MIEIQSVLAVLSLLVIASGAFFASKKLKIPYSVLLVLVGLIIVPVVNTPGLNSIFGFLGEVTLTPELLFFIFLPILIFESAFNMNIRRMVDNVWSISSLAVGGLLISMVGIATILYILFPFVGLEVPFIVVLLFGAIISSTDPVAVLAMFKEFGAPKRLSMIFEGESLFNDGTAVALFLVILAVAQNGFDGFSTVISGVGIFLEMVILGVLFGLVMAAIFSRALRVVKSNEFVAATVLLISAHFVFILSELINESVIFGIQFNVSSIIATTVAALFLGNYSRHSLSPKAETYLTKVTEHFAFMANSLVFLLAGLLFANANVDFVGLILPILLTIVVVAVMRVVAIYAVTVPLNKLRIEETIPPSWQLLLSWGSLRGALAIIIVLLIPDNFEVAGWTAGYPVKDFLLALTIGCILATLFIKAPLMGSIIRKLRLDEPEPLLEAYEADMGVYYLLNAESRFSVQKTRGFVRESEYTKLKKNLEDAIEKAYVDRNNLTHKHGKKVFEQSLHFTAIRIESHTLKQLYVNQEISEPAFRRLNVKLNLQKEKIEYAQHDAIDPSKYIDRKDIFDRLVQVMQTPLGKKPKETKIEEKLQYYRAQMILARKVTKVIGDMQTQHDKPVFLPDVYEKVISRYATYRSSSAAKVDQLLDKHTDEVSLYLATLAGRAVNAAGAHALHYLHDRGVVDEDIEHQIEHKFGLSRLK